MWKLIALVIAVALLAPGTAFAQEKPLPEATKKQLEEIVAIRARIVKKNDDFRKSMSQPAISARYTALQTSYQTARANLAKKLEAENAKTPRDEAAVGAIVAKVQKLDDALVKAARAWSIFGTYINDQSQVPNCFNTLENMGVYTDNWTRLELDMQLFTKLLASVESGLDGAQVRLNEMVAMVGKALDEAEAACKE